MFYFAAALLLAQAAVPDRPNPKALLSESAAAIKKYRSYRISTVITIEMHGGPIDTALEMPSSISVLRPGRVRIEAKSKAGAVTIVSDGQHTWFYLSTLKKYVERNAAAAPEAVIGSSSLLPKNLPDLAQAVKSVKITGEDALDVGGQKIPCWIVETTYNQIFLPEQNLAIHGAVQTNWIARDTRLSLQSNFTGELNMPNAAEPVHMEQSTRTTSLHLNPRLSPSLFSFTPPPDAKKTADWTLPGIARPDVAGKPAPEFKTKTLDGKPVDLAALRGKVVLIDFRTTWCKPCETELPALTRLSAEFRDKGLVVVAMNVGEDRPAVEKYLALTRIAFPVIALPDGDELLSTLSINAFPTTVVIDREGKIASYEAGDRGESALRSDLAKAGLK